VVAELRKNTEQKKAGQPHQGNLEAEKKKTAISIQKRIRQTDPLTSGDNTGPPRKVEKEKEFWAKGEDDLAQRTAVIKQKAESWATSPSTQRRGWPRKEEKRKKKAKEGDQAVGRFLKKEENGNTGTKSPP